MYSGMPRFMVSLFVLVALSFPLFCQSKKMDSTNVRPRMAGAGATRVYYIAADDVVWDYLYTGMDGITGRPFESLGYFANPTPGGARLEKPVPTAYLKTLYREYTDDTFKTLKKRPPEWEHLGFLGPLIRAEVGNTIKVVFRNNAAHPHSIHAHGVFYNKDSEGAPYQDGTSGADKADDAVPPGGTHTYTWQVPERAGPASGDTSSILWMYHSHTDEYRDPNTGLIGPMIITARGQAKPDGSPRDVERELVVMFAQTHEEDSWHAERNLPNLATEVALQMQPVPSSANAAYPYFVRFSINGFSHGNMPLRSVTIHRGEHVRWYLFSGINDFDMHAPHWHGNTVVINQMRTDVTSLLQMQMLVADMVPDDPGIWLFHCHVSFHNTGGMVIRYVVLP
jgi:manganese oxidase